MGARLPGGNPYRHRQDSTQKEPLDERHYSPLHPYVILIKNESEENHREDSKQLLGKKKGSRCTNDIGHISQRVNDRGVSVTQISYKG